MKSTKTHLYRIIGDQEVLTYEEFYTFLCQIESILNSRPLYPLSDDPNDLSVLTPGHFLTLQPLSSLPVTYRPPQQEMKKIAMVCKSQLLEIVNGFNFLCRHHCVSGIAIVTL